MGSSRVAVASLGGTITMMSAQPDGLGISPSLDADELMSTVPALSEIAAVQTATLDSAPGASLDISIVLRALNWARSTAEEVDGVSIIQGTDTIEETAYLLDLYWDRPEPLIVTGAMRSPQTPGADGPANLLAAVRVAADPASRDRGVLIVMNDEVHAASRVRKSRASGTGAFESPSFGPVGYVEEGSVVFGSGPCRYPALQPPRSEAPAPRVALLETSLGDKGELLDLAAEARFDGIVLAGFGVGHVARQLALSVEAHASALPIVLTTRTGAGTTFTKTYDFSGSEIDLLGKGAVPAGWLDPRKARILLSCLLMSDRSRKDIHAEFLRRGGNPSAGIHMGNLDDASTSALKGPA